jgi:hypothetical protein
LIERFGEGFFTEVAWDRIVAHLGRLHSKDVTPITPYKAHADIYAFQRAWVVSAEIVTGNAHPLPYDISRTGGIANVLPLYGDVEFWQVLNARYPKVFATLSKRWASLPDSIITRYEGRTVTINPRRLLRDHFPDTYQYLLDEAKVDPARIEVPPPPRRSRRRRS